MKFSLAILFLVLSVSSVSAAQDSEEFVTEHPFQKRDLETKNSSSFGSRGLASKDGEQASFSMRSNKMLDTLRVNSRIRSHQKTQRAFNLYTKDRIQTIQYSFDVDGFPLCDYELKIHESLSGQMSAIGQIPKMDVNREFSDSDWLNDADLFQALQEVFTLKGYNADLQINKKRRCLWNVKGELEPVFEVEARNDSMSFIVVLDAQQVYRFEPQLFHALGKLSIFPNNELDSERRVFEIPNMEATGLLQNDFFVACLPSGNLSPNCPTFEGNTRILYEVAREASGTFNYDVNSEYSKYAQSSIFTNANRALAWLQEVGYTSFGSTPIRLAVHAAFDKDVNNALYEPRPSYSMIYVGDGDNNVLQNLATDSDVVSHELGHHVVYNSIKRIEGESLVLHEGLADYLTFARTGNACLGESICPDTSLGARICAVPKQCLRTAENDYSLTGADLPREAHQKSQFISGFLWDLTKKDQIPLNNVAFMVLKGIDLLVSNSGYRHFVIGILLADNANFNGKYCETIRNRAFLRGLGSFLGDVTCQKIKEEPTNGTVETYLGSSTDTGSTTTETRKGKTGCGVLPGLAGGGQKSTQLIILFLPLIVLFIQRLFK